MLRIDLDHKYFFINFVLLGASWMRCPAADDNFNMCLAVTGSAAIFSREISQDASALKKNLLKKGYNYDGYCLNREKNAT